MGGSGEEAAIANFKFTIANLKFAINAVKGDRLGWLLPTAFPGVDSLHPGT
jgi:hypothetical protein